MKKAKRQKRTIASVAERAILAGKSTEQVIAQVRRAFPKAKTTPACVAWYRHDLRERGVKVPDAPKKKKEGRAA
jgi:hypothetical protein